MRTRFLAACAVAAFWLIGPAPGALAGSRGEHAGGPHDSVAMAGEAYVAKGQVHEGDMVAIMGNVRVDGTVTGDVVVILGSLDLSGTVEGDVVAVMSPAHLADSAVVNGDLVSVGRSLDQAAGSRVDGQVVNLCFLRFIPFSEHGVGWSWLAWFAFLVKLATLAAFFLILLLIAALIPRRLAVMAAAFPRRWGYAFLIGLVAWAGAFVGCVVLVITIIGVPLAAALLCAAFVTKWIGLAGILYLIGQTVGRNLLHRDLAHVPAVLGGFGIYAILSLLPLVGTIFGFALSFFAVGIALLTRFGAEEPAVTPAPQAPVPPSYGGPEPPPVVAS